MGIKIVKNVVPYFERVGGEDGDGDKNEEKTKQYKNLICMKE